jgi:hypothetical protein
MAESIQKSQFHYGLPAVNKPACRQVRLKQSFSFAKIFVLIKKAKVV